MADNRQKLCARVVGRAWATPWWCVFVTRRGGAWVPLMTVALWRVAVPRITLLGIALGLVGVAVLSEVDSGGAVAGWGEAITLFASVLFAVQIIVLDVLGRRVRPANMSAAFLATTGLCALAVALAGAAFTSGVGDWVAWLVLDTGQARTCSGRPARLTVLSTVIAFHWMNKYQPRVSASRASLIYLLEPVFAAVFSVMWGYDTLSGRLLIGGAMHPRRQSPGPKLPGLLRAKTLGSKVRTNTVEKPAVSRESMEKSHFMKLPLFLLIGSMTAALVGCGEKTPPKAELPPVKSAEPSTTQRLHLRAGGGGPIPPDKIKAFQAAGAVPCVHSWGATSRWSSPPRLPGKADVDYIPRSSSISATEEAVGADAGVPFLLSLHGRGSPTTHEGPLAELAGSDADRDQRHG